MNVFAHYSTVANTENTTTRSGSKNKAGLQHSDNGKNSSGRKPNVSGKPEGTLRLASLGSAGGRKLTVKRERFG